MIYFDAKKLLKIVWKWMVIIYMATNNYYMVPCKLRTKMWIRNSNNLYGHK